MTQSKAPDLGDPLQVAVKVTTIEGTLALLQQQVSGGLANVSSRLDAMQAEQRETTKVVSDVARQQHDLQSHSEGLDRLARAIDRNSGEFAAWRKEHEADNKGVSDKVTSFRGALVGFGLLGAVVVTVAMLWINAEFANVRREVTAQSQYQGGERARIERDHDRDVQSLRNELKEFKDTRGLK